MADRSDRLWAYSKATAGTGGLAAVLSTDAGGLRQATVSVLHMLLASWSSAEFWASIEALLLQTERVSHASWIRVSQPFPASQL